MPGNKTKKIKEDNPQENVPNTNVKKQRRFTIKKKPAENPPVEPEKPTIFENIINVITGKTSPPPPQPEQPVIPKKKGRKPKIRIIENEPPVAIEAEEIAVNAPTVPPKKKSRKPCQKKIGNGLLSAIKRTYLRF